MNSPSLIAFPRFSRKARRGIYPAFSPSHPFRKKREKDGARRQLVPVSRVLRFAEFFREDIAMRKNEPLGTAQHEHIGKDRRDGKRTEDPRAQPRRCEVT